MADEIQKVKIKDLTNTDYDSVKGNGYLVVDDGTEAKKMAVSAIAKSSDVPTKVSQLTNDSGFITSADIPSIPTKTSDLTNDGDGTTGNKMVKSSDITSIVKVTELPESPDANTLYLVVEEEATTASETEAEV